jgi:uncharacterized membrane protein YkoI
VHKDFRGVDYGKPIKNNVCKIKQKNRSEENMKMVTFKKVICGVSLGTVMALGSMSSAFAADLNHSNSNSKQDQHQQQQDQHQQQQDQYQHQQQQQDQYQYQPVQLLTPKQAESIALQQYKGVLKDIQLTMENGKDVYIIVIHDQNGNDYTVKVDAITGAIVNYNYYDAQRNNYYNDQNGKTNNDQNGNSNNYNHQNGKTNSDQNGNSNNTQKGKTN